MTVTDVLRASGRAVATAWRAFGRWRHSRPFWGGLFTLLAGVELFFSTQLSPGTFQIRIGEEGLQAYVIPAVLILAGLLLWFTPAQRPFYSVITLLVAVASLALLNLGGFLLGTVLGMVGGALGVAWVPVPPPVNVGTPDAGAPDVGAPDAGALEAGALDAGALEAGALDGVASDAEALDAEVPDGVASDAEALDAEVPDGGASEAEPLDTEDGRPEPAYPPGVDDPDHVGSDAMTAAVLAGIVPEQRHPTTVDQAARVAEVQPEEGGTEPPAPGDDPARPPAPEGAGGPRPGAHRAGGATMAIVLVVASVAAAGATVFGHPTLAAAQPCPTSAGRPAATLSPGTTVSPRATVSTSTTVSTSATVSPGSTVSPGASGSPSASAPAGAPGTPCQTAATSGMSSAVRAPVRRLATTAGQPLVDGTASLLISADISMSGLSYDGVVDLPTSTGTIQVLQFSMTSTTCTPFELDVPTAAGTFTERSSTLSMAMSASAPTRVYFYTNLFQGNLFGLDPVKYTPDTPPVITVPDVFFTDARVQLLYATAPVLTISSMNAVSPT